MNRILDKTAIQQKIGFGGPGILRINKLLALSPLRRRAHATSHRRQPRADAGGTEAIQYSNTGTAAPSSSSDSPCCVGLKD